MIQAQKDSRLVGNSQHLTLTVDTALNTPILTELADVTMSPAEIPGLPLSPRRQPQSIKIDALYKPILRRFRSLFRKQFEKDHNKKRFQQWKNSEFVDEVIKFMIEKLQVPKDLLDAESVEKMLVILFPCITKRPAYAAKKRHPLVLIFKENNHSLRMMFFSDPLIKFLWKYLFIREHPDILINHLRRIRSHDDFGEMKYERFVKDL